MADHDAENARPSVATALIAAERRRQVEVEGYTEQHDAEHGRGVLAAAAIEYATARWGWRWPTSFWPWDEAAFKPRDRVSNLIRAGALYLAALDQPQPENRHWQHESTDHLRQSLAQVTAELDATLDAAHRVCPALPPASTPEEGQV